VIEGHRDEAFVHRLEAFSDIVIGFTVAQIGATLVIPNHAASLFNPLWLLSFLWTFGLICLMWLLHNRLFRTVFAPTPLAIVLNFTLLAGIVLMVYFAEVMIHGTTLEDTMIYSRFYYLALASVFALIALLTYMGARDRRGELEPAVHGRALRVGFVNVVAAATIALGVGASLVVGGTSWVWFVGFGLSVPAGFALGRLLNRTAGA